MSRTILSATTALLAAASFARAAPVRQDGFDAVWTIAAANWRERVTKAGIVGSSLLVQQGRRVLRHEVTGFADVSAQRKVDQDTIYHWASITKTLTGIAILQLRDRGRLTLDDPILAYLPELRAVHGGKGKIGDVTLRHLLSHSAGFRGPTWPWGGKESWHPHEPTEWSQLVAMMPYTELLFEPGTRFSYSNLGIVFLGRVIEILSGDDYEVYMDKNVLKPLGMHRSYFDHTPYHLLRHRSDNYSLKAGKPVSNGLDFDTGVTVSNGGLNAPLADMSLYLAFLLDAEGIDADARGVLSRASLEEMWKPVQPLDPDRPEAGAMGLTFFVYGSGESRTIGHTGGQKSFATLLLFSPEGRVGSLGAFNTTAGDILLATQRELRESVFPVAAKL